MLSPEKEPLRDIAEDIALDNYGFLYVEDHKDIIKPRYEEEVIDGDSLSDSIMKSVGKGSVSGQDIKQTLRTVAKGDISSLQRLRNGVYFTDPFNDRDASAAITQKLTNIFEYQSIVVTEHELVSQFDIAPNDAEFFTQKLEEQNFVQGIVAGERSYYTIGPRLKDEADSDAGVGVRLQENATEGIISHADLESVIDVAATEDVIRYLEKEDFIISLDDEYLVRDAIDDFGGSAALEIRETVEEEFTDSGYILPDGEFEQLLESELRERFDVIEHLDQRDRDAVIEAVQSSLAGDNVLGLAFDKRVVRMEQEFDDYVDQRADEIRREVDAESLSTPSDFKSEGYPLIDDLTVSNSQVANQYLHEQMKERFDTKVDEIFQS
jgi:hypothetical protein